MVPTTLTAWPPYVYYDDVETCKVYNLKVDYRITIDEANGMYNITGYHHISAISLLLDLLVARQVCIAARLLS